ncbi:hypothetical protein LIER_33230 [Lithospermum erythrorhizon]|uniref:Uncharacterized protein n=1 Tax=Lithospermum erythrorhizon TaxID=34254 RepID=A0AAV3S055_LITER
MGKQKSHSNGVLERCQNHLVSRISAMEEERIPANTAVEAMAMKRLWRAGIGPSGIGRRRRKRRRRRWRVVELKM